MSKASTKADKVDIKPATGNGVAIERVAMEDDRHLWQLVQIGYTGDKVTSREVRYGPDELRYVIEKYAIWFRKELMTNGTAGVVNALA